MLEPCPRRIYDVQWQVADDGRVVGCPTRLTCEVITSSRSPGLVSPAYFTTVIGGRKCRGKRALLIRVLKGCGPGRHVLRLLCSSSFYRPSWPGWWTHSFYVSSHACRRTLRVERMSRVSPILKRIEGSSSTFLADGVPCIEARYEPAALPPPPCRARLVRWLDWMACRRDLLACRSAARVSSTAISLCSRCASGMAGFGSVWSSAAAAAMFWIALANCGVRGRR